MGYKVKWIEENLGVSRNALRGFEKKGLMPVNENRQYRDYDDDDVDRIWTIRVFQGMGYTLQEIADMANDENFDFDTSISKKIKELEEQKERLEKHLGYAKTIKFTGRLPIRPKKMGETKFDDFKEQAISEWNINNDPKAVEYQKVAETVLSKPPEDWEDSDLGRMFSLLESIAEMDIDILLFEYILPKAIAQRMDYGPEHPEIQLMVKMIYENQQKLCSELEISVDKFSRFYSSSFLSGDVAKLKLRELTAQECDFIAEAVAIFGGYEGVDELIEEELKHGR